MSGKYQFSADTSAPLGASAYVVVEKANCLYDPNPKSPVRVVPPIGTEVEVVREEGSWVLIRFCHKEAWSPRENLSSDPACRMNGTKVGIEPAYSNIGLGSYPGYNAGPEPLNIEYGPRGGRFVRTALGFRRYF